jgi:hypothetical protein
VFIWRQGSCRVGIPSYTAVHCTTVL